MIRRALLPAIIALSLCSGVTALQRGWQASPEVVKRTTAQQPQFNFEESRVGSYELPDALKSAPGTVVTVKDWDRRRAEILELFRENVYGRSPGRPEQLRFETIEENPRALDGAAALKRVAIMSGQGGREHRFELTLFVPNARKAAAPVFLLLNNRPATNTDPTRTEKSGFWPAEQVIKRGCAVAALQVGQLAADNNEHFREGVIGMFEGTTAGPRAANAWAGLAAWGWGASRAMDYFESDSLIDARRVALIGHSRGGKAALWAGAEDPRFALVISNESGEGGAALSRRQFGETVARITESFPFWFAGNYKTFSGRESALPVDQHMLMGLIAPRALYVASADEDLWSDPRGEFLSLAHSSPVFALWGDKPIRPDDMPPLEHPLIVNRRGYHIRPGPHNLTPYDWDRFVDFGETIWKK
jgi:hypothetical protein